MERKITIEESAIYQEDYQMRMLQANRIEGLLEIRGRGVDTSSYYDYDVSGKVSLKAMYERSPVGAEDIRDFLKRVSAVVRDLERHLLNIHCLLLEPEYIYYEEKKYYFCYYPPGGGDLWQALHTLTEYFVKHADYTDQSCMQMVFLLHKETMEENYSLEKLVQRCVQDKETKSDRRENAPESEKSVCYDQAQHDWIAGQELSSAIMEETENLWTPVRRFLRRHRKPKWGDWDGLYIEEEEL